ncbi:putative disease resistance protein At4g27220 [Bidens hawaiensis]|uniref:putative disease resistance protein At4g27220 n=1 Tax=Bidens hawaiensis TaxID=980011 RepID=UPI004049334F
MMCQIYVSLVKFKFIPNTVPYIIVPFRWLRPGLLASYVTINTIKLIFLFNSRSSPIVTMEAFGKPVFKFICSRIKTFSKYEKNIEELREEIASLISKRTAIEEDVKLAKLEGNVPKPQVIYWLNKVSRAEDDVRPLLEMADEHTDGMASKMMQCLTVATKLNLVKELNSINFDSVARERSSPIKSVVEMAVPHLMGQEAASDLKQLLEILNTDGIRSIAVWGKGGIGKTTLVKNLNNELRISTTTSFDIVIWVEVSRSSDLSTIQLQIAKRIHLKVDADDTTNRIASRILQRLKLRRKILLILDDVWEKIDLDAVGIPSRDPGCKILLTTRSRDVCRHMAVDASFPLNLMSEEDSWNFFVHSAGPVLDSNNIESPARKIVAGFNGLPLAIKTLGNSMRDRPQIELWRNAHLMWRCSSSSLFKNIEKEIFGTLATSYYFLPSKILKQCFLFCSLYPAGFSIDVRELIQCWVSDGLIIENHTVEETFDYGLALIERLKDSCLLDQDSEGTVKMHDIFRDLAILLSQSQELLFGFHTQSGHQFYQMPNESSRRVSLTRCRIKKLPDFPIYSHLTVLFLQGNPLQKIPNEFFHSFISLRVLNLSDTQITSLPASFLCLCELRSLFLRNCPIEKLPSFKSCCKLLVLDLSGTHIKALPNGFGNLHSLRELNLSRTPFLNKIVVGNISGLTSLQTLDMSFSSYNWNPKTGADRKATFDELLTLEHLSVLKIRLDSVRCLESASLWLKELTRFDIQISPWSHDSNHHVAKQNEKRLVLRGVDLLQEDLRDLLHNTSSLVVLTCVGMTRRQLLSLSSLTSLTISNCNDITCLISMGRSSKEMFPNLQHLVLDHLQNLKFIVEGIIPRGVCLKNLTTIKVSDCPMLKGAVSYAMLRHAKKLEEIKVSGCKTMSCIIESGEHEASLPNLRVLEIGNMVKLRSISDGASVFPVLQYIKVLHCFGLKNLPLSISNSCSLKKIEGDAKWWNDLRWDADEDKNFFQQHFQAHPSENNNSRKRKYK